MAESPARPTLAAVVLFVVVPLVVWTLIGGPLRLIGRTTAPAPASQSAEASDRHEPAVPGPVSLLADAWHRVRVPLGGLAVIASGLLVTRARARRRRGLCGPVADSGSSQSRCGSSIPAEAIVARALPSS